MDLNWILSPLAAFFFYAALVAVLSGFGKMLAPSLRGSANKTSTYASGEAAPEEMGAPGYRQFFVVALFFAILHLGVLMLASGIFNWVMGVYLLGLMLALLVLILG